MSTADVLLSRIEPVKRLIIKHLESDRPRYFKSLWEVAAQGMATQLANILIWECSLSYQTGRSMKAVLSDHYSEAHEINTSNAFCV